MTGRRTNGGRERSRSGVSDADCGIAVRIRLATPAATYGLGERSAWMCILGAADHERRARGIVL